MTNFGIRKLAEPVQSAIVDSFCDVETEVEATVIASPQNEHEFSSFMFHLCDFKFWVFSLEEVGVYQSGLVPEIFWAFAEMLGEMELSLFLENVRLTIGNWVPEFWFSLMEEVYRWEIEIFLVPAEKGLPRSNVTVGWSNSLDLDVDSMVEEGIQGVEVPGASPLIHKRVEKISSVDGGRKDNIFPELN